MTVSLLLACSGARGKESPPVARPQAPAANGAKPCDKSPDAGGADAPASSYYQIGTCPDDESTPR